MVKLYLHILIINNIVKWGLKENMMLKKKRNLFVSIAILIVLVLIPSVVYGYNSYSYKKHYNLALENLNQDKYEEAKIEFSKALEYKKNKEKEINTQTSLIDKLKLSKSDYEQAVILFNEKKYIESIAAFEKVIKEDEERYNEAQEKVKESKALFVSDNLNKAKEEATSKKFQEAISYLDTIINFDSSNSEAVELKNQYTSEIEKIEVAKKETEAKAKKETETKAKKAVEETAKKTAEEKVTKEEENKPSTTIDKPSSPTNEEDIVSANNGFFVIKDSKGNLKAVFGLMPLFLNNKPEQINFKVSGNSLDYEINFHFIGGRIETYKGKTSDEYRMISATSSEVPSRQGIKITISIVYNGKEYTDTFTKVLVN